MVILTHCSLEHFNNSLALRGRGIGIRLTILDAGEEGYTYAVDYIDREDEIAETDHRHTIDDLLIVTDVESCKLLKGTEIDFVKEGLNKGFHFKNPNARIECEGCGESFHI